MTINQFLTRLAKVAKTRAFSMSHGTRIRTVYGNQCPIMAVYEGSRPLALSYGNAQFMEAAHEIGLREDTARKIVTAADELNYTNYTPAQSRIYRALRTKLTTACRISDRQER